MSESYRVSAIVSTYNSEKFIDGCLQDLIGQTLYSKGELEIVVIDSASPQKEGDIVKRYMKEYRHIVYERTAERESLYASWNRGIKIARGKYITNANTDDRHRKDTFEVLSKTMDDNDAWVAYGDCFVSHIDNQNFKDIDQKKCYLYPKFFPPAAILHYQFGPQPMWRKSLHDEIGYFEPEFKAAGDWDFNIRVALRYPALHVQEFLGVFLKSPHSITRRDNTMILENHMVKMAWRKCSVIERLYQRAGFTIKNQRDCARMWVDMGLRSLEFYPPWIFGNVDRDLEFTMHCFEKAIESDPEWYVAFNNYALSLSLLNDTKNSLAILRKINKKVLNTSIAHNLEYLHKHSNDKINIESLLFLPSGLKLPTQKDLANFKMKSKVSSLSRTDDIKKILFICHDFPPHRMAGAQLYVKSLAETINARGHFNVDVLHPVFRGELQPGAFSKIQQSNLNVYKYGKIRTGNNFLQVRDERILEDIAKFIQHNNYDIIHVHTLAEFTAAALEASIESSKPTIMTAHDQWLICEQWFMIDPTTSRHCGGPTSPEKCADCFLASMGNAPEISKVDLVKYQAMRLHYMKLLAKRLKRLYVPSQSLANDFANFGIPGAKVLPLGLKPSFPLPKKKNRAITFGYLGQIRPAKGLHTLIEAFVKFCSHDVKLEIHGNYEQTPYTAKLLYMSKKHPGIDFCGPFVPEDLPRIYSGLDLMINPSMNESFSITIREAFQHGVPVVASNVGGIPEIVNNNHNGFLFPPGHSQYLGKILSHLSNKPSKINGLKNEIPKIETIDDNACKYEKVYDEIKL